MSELLWNNVETSSTSSERRPFMTINKGDNIVRIISNPILNKTSHYLAGPNKFVNCEGEGCNFCKQGLRKREEYKVYVIDRTDGEIKQLTFGPQLLKEIAKIMQDEDQKEFGTFIDYDIKINKSGEGQSTEYTATAVNSKKYLVPLTPVEKTNIAALPPLKPSKNEPKDVEDAGLAEDDEDEEPVKPTKEVNKKETKASKTVTTNDDWDSIG